jgi:hypothetical protein
MKIDNEELNAIAAVSDETEQPRYTPWSGTHKVVPKERLKAAGWKVTKRMRPVIQVSPEEWVDTETGEILTKTEARKRGIQLPTVRSTSDKALDKHTRLSECTPSERPFVGFLLSMRNRRGGLVAPLDAVLDRWIEAAFPDIRPTNGARKRKQLRSIIERRRLMVNDTTMAKDLMLINPNITKQEMIEEAAKLYDPRYLPLKGNAAAVC